MPRHYSDLEVVRDESQGLEIDDSKQHRISVHEFEGHKIWVEGTDHWTSEGRNKPEKLSAQQHVRRRGLWSRPWSRTFKASLAIAALVLVLAAVGGGVGGALASRSSNGESEQELATSGAVSNATSYGTVQTDAGASNNSLSTSTDPTRTTNSITYSTSVLPEGTFTRDCPSSSNSLYSVSTGAGEPLLFRKMCGKDFMGPWQPYSDSVVTVNRAAKSLDECITMCVSANTANRAAIATKEKLACNAVCWRNGGPGDIWPHNCFAGQTFNASGTFAAYDEVFCDSATWINQSA